jgi:hypothetical protein
MRRPPAVPVLTVVPPRPGRGPWDALLAPVRAARRRWNARVGLRALAHAVTILGAAAAVVVVLVVAAAPLGFALGTAAVTVATLALAAAALRAARRAWLPARRAAAWVDARADLGGGLAALAGVASRRPTALVPLLAARVAAGRERWSATRLVPHVVPRAALAAALLTAYALVLVVTAAPRWRPVPPRLVATDRVHGLPAPDDGIPRTPAVAPTGAAPATGAGAASADPTGATGGGAIPADGGLLAVPRALQARLQAALWGAPLALTRAAGGDGGRTPGVPGRTPRPGTGHAIDGAGRARDGAVAKDGAAGREAGGAASGAGTATDPDLLGPDGVLRHTGPGRFALGLGARVYGPRGGARPPEGEAPAPEPDERPALGAVARTPAPLHRLGIPPDLAPAVRAAYERAP